MNFATRLLVVGFGVLYLGVAAAQSQDPDRCIDKVPVWVDDSTDTFFAPFIANQLQRKLSDIESMEELELTRVQRERKSQFTSPRRDDEVELEVSDSEVKKIRIRTSWKGGLKDLVFIQASGNAVVNDGDLRLTFSISDDKAPNLSVTGTTCNFTSRRGATIVSSYPEKVDGRNQNYKNLATFLAYQLIKLSEVDGCNLGSETKPVLLQLSSRDQALSIPMGAELMSLEASAQSEDRYEQVIFPEQNPALAALGQAESVFFNRPTDFVYRTAHPFRDLEWTEVEQWQVPDDDICDVFDKSRADASIRTFTFSIPDEALDNALLKLKIDTGADFFQRSPDLVLSAKWYSDAAMTQLVSESALTKVATSQKTSEGILELRGTPQKLLPGRYVVKLEWKRSTDVPVAESASFLWNSTDEYNVSDNRGVFGPQFIKLLRSPDRSANRIMKNYFFEQAITKRSIRWESWPDSSPKRFAAAILWHFEATGQLPYLSQWEGEAGIAPELVRALSVVSKVDGGLTDPDAQHALQYLGRLERAPDSFKKRNIRKAMCVLSSELEQQGEPIPALWMRCDG